jgi:rod shape-determining protein MreC
VVIDKGSQHGIAAGQAVVDDIGVIGQVTRVFPLTSEVLLLTDKDQAIPVAVQRNGLRAVLAGAGAGMMELRFLAANAEVQVGDILVTSGLDGVYLPGLPVAKVVKIDRDSSYSFARITCAPLAGVERHGLALVLGSRTELPPQPEDTPATPDQPARGKRVKKKDDDNPTPSLSPIGLTPPWGGLAEACNPPIPRAASCCRSATGSSC